MALAQDIHIGDVMQTITLRVRGLAGQRLRFRIAARLIRLAGWIARTPVEIEIDSRV